MKPKMIGLDWGTTSLKAYLLAEDAVVLDRRKSPLGTVRLMKNSKREGLSLPYVYDSALRSLCGDWFSGHPDIPVVASGMVGSSGGWKEVPYSPLPFRIQSDFGSLPSVNSQSAGTVFLVPGLLLEKGNFSDVMRGEETQVIGVGSLLDKSALQGDLTVVLPGTHTKWVTVESGIITEFRTFMTGEIYGLLMNHSILGQNTSETVSKAWSVFDEGLEYSSHLRLPGDLLSGIFSVRVMALTQRLSDADVSDYLSGILIGSEVRAATESVNSKTFLVSGTEDLMSRYIRAFESIGRSAIPAGEESAANGLWNIARSAGLLERGSNG